MTNLATFVNPVANHLFVAVDIGTNTFKLLIVRTNSTTGKFLAIDCLKELVVVGRDIPASSTIPPAIIFNPTINTATAITKTQTLARHTSSDRSGEFSSVSSQSRRLLVACASENSDELIRQLVSGLKSSSINDQKQAAIGVEEPNQDRTRWRNQAIDFADLIVRS